MSGRVGDDFGVDLGFYFANLRVAHRRVMRKVEARFLCVNQRALLRDV